MRFKPPKITNIGSLFVTAAQLGEVLGLSVFAVHRLSRDGVLPTAPRPGGKKLAYPLAACVQAYIGYVRPKAEMSGTSFSATQLRTILSELNNQFHS